MTVPRHSARRAGMKQKRVDPLVFQAFVAERRRAEIAEARVAELEAAPCFICGSTRKATVAELGATLAKVAPKGDAP